MDIVSSISSPNIALVKYWGKKSGGAKTPLNDNLSMTLSDEVLKTETTICFTEELDEDKFVLAGKVVDDDKMKDALILYKNRLKDKWPSDKKLLIISENNFPTAAGIASSASGYSALATALAEALNVNEPKERSILSRLGSGSASRSVLGGYVRWKRGERDDGEDSYAVQIAPKSHWPDLVDVLAVISRKEKKVGSRSGMKQTVKNSVLHPTRVDYVNNTRIEKVQKAIMDKDFETLAIETMKDSNNMHATMLDTWPPIFYMTDVSRDIVYAVHDYNEGEIKAGYTFDAGPNAHIITTKSNMGEIKSLLKDVEGVEDVLTVPIGDGPRIVEPNKSLVEKWLAELR